MLDWKRFFSFFLFSLLLLNGKGNEKWNKFMPTFFLYWEWIDRVSDIAEIDSKSEEVKMCVWWCKLKITCMLCFVFFFLKSANKQGHRSIGIYIFLKYKNIQAKHTPLTLLLLFGFFFMQFTKCALCATDN